MSNRRRRSILKSSGRNSIAPCDQLEEDFEEQRKVGKDITTSTATVTLPFAARKRVSFGQHHIKEFDLQILEKTESTVSSAEQTVRGEVDMEFSSDDEMNKSYAYLENEMENMPPGSKSMMDRTKFGGSMVEETMLLDKTRAGLTFTFPSHPTATEEFGDKTVWGGTMGADVDLMNQTYAVPPMNLPKNADKTIYGGVIEGLEQTIMNQTFVRDAVVADPVARAPELSVPEARAPEIPAPVAPVAQATKIPASVARVPEIQAPVARASEISAVVAPVAQAPKIVASVARIPEIQAPVAPVPVASAPLVHPTASLKIAFPTYEGQPCGNLPVKKPRKERNKPGIFGTAITPKRPLFSMPQDEEEEDTNHHHLYRPVASTFAQTSFAYGPNGANAVSIVSVPVAIDAQTSPAVIGKELEEQEERKESRRVESASFALQTSFSFCNGVDAQTSPFVFTKETSSMYGGSPLRCQNLAIVENNKQSESPTHIAMISTCMENVTLSNAPEEFQQEFQSNFEVEPIDINSSPPPPQSPPNNFITEASSVPEVEESLAELSLHESCLQLSEDLIYFIENSNELSAMEWIVLTRCVRNEVLLIPEENWTDFEEKHSWAFRRVQGYWDTLVDQRKVLMELAANVM